MIVPTCPPPSNASDYNIAYCIQKGGKVDFSHVWSPENSGPGPSPTPHQSVTDSMDHLAETILILGTLAIALFMLYIIVNLLFIKKGRHH